MLPNRIALYFLIASGIAGAVVPVLADFDTASVVGWVAGIGAIALAVGNWLVGWQKYEERTDLIEAGVPGFGEPGAPPPGQ